jgi:hypothetical protein
MPYKSFLFTPAKQRKDTSFFSQNIGYKIMPRCRGSLQLKYNATRTDCTRQREGIEELMGTKESQITDPA